MGAVVHRCFSSLKNCWHLSFQVMAVLFLPAFLLDVNSLQGLGYLHELGDKSGNGTP